MDPGGDSSLVDLLVQIGVYAFMALFTVVVVVEILRGKRGPKKLHDLAARLAARHGGRVVPGPFGRPRVEIIRGPHRLEIEWWKGMLGRGRRGPLTWVTLGPAASGAATGYPEFLSVGRHRGGYGSSLDLAHLDVKLGDPELERV